MSASKRPSIGTECNPSKKRKLTEDLHFCTLKCTVAKSSEVLSRLKTEVVLAHEIFKITTLYFSLEKGEAPSLNLSVVKECITRVCT